MNVSPENALSNINLSGLKLSHGLHMLDGITVITKRPLNCVHMHPAGKSSVDGPLELFSTQHKEADRADPRKADQAIGTHWNDITFVIEFNLVWFHIMLLLIQIATIIPPYTGKWT